MQFQQPLSTTLFCKLSFWSANTLFVLSHACFVEVVGFFSCHIAFEWWCFALFNPCCKQMACKVVAPSAHCPTLIDFYFVPRAFAFRWQFFVTCTQTVWQRNRYFLFFARSGFCWKFRYFISKSRPFCKTVHFVYIIAKRCLEKIYNYDRLVS